MPVCQSLIVLVSVLLCAMLVAHYSSASSVKSVKTAAGHCLVAIPVSLSITRFSIFQTNLAVHSWAQRISVLSSEPVHVSRSNNDWLWVLMVNLFTSLVWLACCIASVYMSDNWGGLWNLLVITGSHSRRVQNASIGRVSILRDTIECRHYQIDF